MWFRKAADRGNGPAQYSLGLMYQNGQGVPQDFAQAHMYFNLAASHAEAAGTRDSAVKARDLVATLMTPAQVDEARRMARECVPK